MSTEIDVNDPWLWAPFGTFLGVTIIGTIFLRCTRQGWLSSVLLASFMGAALMFLLRGFKVDPECIQVTVIDTIESAIMIIVGTAVIIHYIFFTLRDNPYRRLFGFFNCSREEDILTPIYPPDLTPRYAPLDADVALDV